MSSTGKDENANILVISSEGSSANHSQRSINLTRKSVRDARSRLLSDSSDEVPKSILKNRSRIPTKRSVSECVDDLSQIMADLDITIDDFSKATGKFCPHIHSFFDECEEDTCEGDANEDDEDDDDDQADEDDEDADADDDEDEINGIGTELVSKFRNDGDQLQHGKQKKCDCILKQLTGDSTDSSVDKPKKSVRFDEKVYETYFIASRLYDRRNFAKYHSSTRHHPAPPNKKQQSKKKKNKKNSLKNSENNGDDHGKSDETSSCKLSKSQRAKQSKKDKKKRMNKRDDSHETSSDDQGYCSATLHS